MPTTSSAAFGTGGTLRMSVIENVDTGVLAAASAQTQPAALHKMRWPVRSFAAAALTVGAAAIHLAVAPEHLAEFPLYGTFFIFLGVVQAGLAVAVLVGPSRGVL